MRHAIDSLILLWGWPRLAVAVAAGGAASLALAPLNAFPVLWVTMPVLVWLLDGAVPRRDAGFFARLVPGAVAGWAFGFGYFLGGFWWIGQAFLVAGGPLVWLMPLAVAGLAGVLALYWGLAAAAARLLWSDGPERIGVLAATFAVAEWLRGHLFTGIPWNAFGYVLAPDAMLMQSASLVGVWGLTLAAFLVFAAPAALYPAADRAAGRRGRGLAVVALALLAAHAGFGAVRLALAGTVPDVAGAGEDAIVVRIVHPGIAQRIGWSPGEMADAVARMVAFSGADGAWTDHRGPRVLVWPEAAFPFVLGTNAAALGAIADLLPVGATLVTGAVREGRDGAGARRWFNAVQVVDDRGEIVARHDKVRLLPFGEYLPGAGFLSALGLRPFVALPGGFAAGDRTRAIDLNGLPPFAASVCYEATFPDAVVPVDRRPAWLVNVTNDGWFAGTPGVEQHYQQVRLRAVEQGLPLVRAANAGVSAIVDPFGRAWSFRSPGQTGFVDGILPQELRKTVFSHAGSVGFWFAVFLLLGFGVHRSIRRT